MTTISKKQKEVLTKDGVSEKKYSGLFINYLSHLGIWNDSDLSYSFGKPDKSAKQITKKLQLQEQEFISTAKEYEVVQLGVYTPFREECSELGIGEVGYLCASIKTIGHTRIGDTITSVDNPCEDVLPGYAEAKPMVFSGIFPVEGEQYEELKEEKWKV